jgi:hypothetical protein
MAGCACFRCFDKATSYGSPCGAGAPQRAACPEPGCTAALPSEAAAALLAAKQAARFAQLQAQRYLATHPREMRCCPQRECGAMLHLPTPRLRSLPATGAAQAEAAEPGEEAAAAAAAVASLAAGAGLGAECRACGHRFCWQCGEEAHEPASCDQVGRRWRCWAGACAAGLPLRSVGLLVQPGPCPAALKPRCASHSPPPPSSRPPLLPPPCRPARSPGSALGAGSGCAARRRPLGRPPVAVRQHQALPAVPRAHTGAAAGRGPGSA